MPVPSQIVLSAAVEGDLDELALRRSMKTSSGQAHSQSRKDAWKP